MLMRAKYAYGGFRTMPIQSTPYEERTVECHACRHTYPRVASPRDCPACGYDRTVGAVEPIPHEYMRFTR